MFQMPELSYNDIGTLIHKALDAANWNLAGVRDNPGDQSWVEAAEETKADLYAWINYQRQMFPEFESSCMLDYEHHWRPRLPFDRGLDRWEFFAAGDTWTIVKPNGKVIATRDPKGKK